MEDVAIVVAGRGEKPMSDPHEPFFPPFRLPIFTVDTEILSRLGSLLAEQLHMNVSLSCVNHGIIEDLLDI